MLTLLEMASDLMMLVNRECTLRIALHCFNLNSMYYFNQRQSICCRHHGTWHAIMHIKGKEARRFDRYATGQGDHPMATSGKDVGILDARRLSH